MEALPKRKVLLVGPTNPDHDKITVPIALLVALLESLKPKSLDGVVAMSPLPDQMLRSPDFWRLLHSCLAEERNVILAHEADTLGAEVSSLALMTGFTNIVSKSGQLYAEKPAFKTGGTKLQRKAKAPVTEMP